MCEGVLAKQMKLKKLQATLTAGERALRLVLQQVILQLTAVGKRLVALATLEGGWSLVAHLMTLQVGVGGKLHAALRANVAATSFMLYFMSTEFTGVCETTATKTTTVGLDICVLQHVPLQVAGLGEALLAHGALVWPCALMRQQVSL